MPWRDRRAAREAASDRGYKAAISPGRSSANVTARRSSIARHCADDKAYSRAMMHTSARGLADKVARRDVLLAGIIID